MVLGGRWLGGMGGSYMDTICLLADRRAGGCFSGGAPPDEGRGNAGWNGWRFRNAMESLSIFTS